MENPDSADRKAKADREKFEKVVKVAVAPLTITAGSRGHRALDIPELKSPDAHNPKWVADPDELASARRAKARAARRSKKEV